MDRALKGTEATVRLTTYVAGAPTDPDEDPTLTVTNAAGEEVHSGVATIGIGTGVSEHVIPASVLSALDVLTVDWIAVVGGDEQTYQSKLEVVGGFHFPIAALRKLRPLGDESKYPTADLLAARTAVEQSLEDACGVAFVPRYGRERVSGTGGCELLLENPEVRSVRSVTVDGSAWASDKLDEIVIDNDAGTLWHPDGWLAGRRNVVVEYEHGYDAPPGRVQFAALRLARYLLVDSTVSDRAVSITNEDGTTQSLVQSAVRGAIFAIPEANAVVRQYGIPAGF